MGANTGVIVVWCGFDESDFVAAGRLACDEARHWISRLARAEQVGWREEVKVAASENRTLSESVQPFNPLPNEEFLKIEKKVL